MRVSEKRCCPHCGSPMNIQKHSLSRLLAECLLALHRAGGRAYVRGMDLPKNGGPNFQKLRYWGLVIKDTVKDSGGDSRWLLTATGLDFIAGNLSLRKHVFTYRGDVQDYAGDLTMFESALSSTRQCRRRREYQQDATAFTGRA